MRVLHLHGGTTADVEVSLHPQVTVVRGLHDPARQWCIDTLGHLAVGRATHASGEVEASGIRFPLTDTALSTLGLVVARDAVLVAADLRPAAPSTTPTIDAGSDASDPGGASTGAASAPVAELGPGPAPAGALGPGLVPVAELGASAGPDARPLADDGPERAVQPLQPVPGAEPVETDAPAAPVAPVAPEPDGVNAVIDRRLAALRQRRLELHRLVQSLPEVDTDAVIRALEELEGAPVGTPVAGAAELADRWRDLQREHQSLELATTPEERAAMAEVARAELVMAEAESVLRQPQLTPEQSRRIEAAHAAVAEAGDKVDRRFGGARARKLLTDAEAEEDRLLARHGFDSWVDYMLSTSKRVTDPQMTRERAVLEQARKEVEHCTAELDAIPGAVARRRRRAELGVRHEGLSTEVAAVLGREPVGAEVEDELRNLCVEADRSRELAGLLRALRAAGADLDADADEVDGAVASAQRFLDGVDHDRRRRDELEVAVAALDEHVEALVTARADGVAELPDLPPLPDMAEPPLGLLDLVADTPVHAVPHGHPVGLAAELPPVDELPPPPPPGNGIAATARDLAEADAFIADQPSWTDWTTRTNQTSQTSQTDQAEAGPEPAGPAFVEPIELLVPESSPESASASASESESAPVPAPVQFAEPATSSEPGPPLAAEPVAVVAWEVQPVDRHALVDDVIWRAMARIAECRADGPAGHLPVVLDDPFDDLDADQVVEVLSRLSRLTDLVQFVIVSDRPEIAAWAHDLGREHALVVG